MLMPKKVKYRKQQRGRMTGKAWRGSQLSFGDFGLKVLEPGWITDRQIEASRVAMTRFVKRGGKIWIRLFPDKPVTKKPAETRMGKGKGAPDHWVAVVRPGKILFEMEGVTRDDAAEAMRLASHKLPLRTTSCVKRETGALRNRETRSNYESATRFAIRPTRNCSDQEQRARRPAVQAEVPAQHGPDREPEEDSRPAQGHCAGEDHHGRAVARRAGDNGEEVMAETTQKAAGRRKEVVGEVVSNKMQKTIVVEVTRKKSHPLYGRVISTDKKFYAHDEKNEAHVGDVVRLEETRPLSKLKRWRLKEIIRKTALVPEVAPVAGINDAQ